MVNPGETPYGEATLGQDRASTSNSTTDQVKDQAKNVASNAGERAADVAGTAKDEAAALKDHAMMVGSDVASSAKEQAGEVVSEVKTQGRRLIDEGMSELRNQAGNSQTKAADLLRGLTSDLHAMSNGQQIDSNGTVSALVERARTLGDDAANWLENSSPEEMLDSVRRYAARNPFTFLAISAGVGFVGARLLRGLKGASEEAGAPAQFSTQSRRSQFASDYSLDGPAYTGTQGNYSTGTGYMSNGTDTAGTYDPASGFNRSTGYSDDLRPQGGAVNEAPFSGDASGQGLVDEQYGQSVQSYGQENR